MIARGIILFLGLLAVPTLAVCLILSVRSLLLKSVPRAKRHGVAALAALAVLAVSAYFLFFDTSYLPEGQLLASYPSPAGTYRMDMYLCNGGATTDNAVRGAVMDTRTGRSRNIYWQYHQSDVEVEWVDEQTVRVSGMVLRENQDVVLNVTDDRYDYRNAR